MRLRFTVEGHVTEPDQLTGHFRRPMVCLSSKPCFGTLELLLGYLTKSQGNRDFQKRSKKGKQEGRRKRNFLRRILSSVQFQSNLPYFFCIYNYVNKINFHNDGTELQQVLQRAKITKSHDMTT